MSTVTLPFKELYDLSYRAFIRNGCDEANATAVSDSMIKAERDGCVSHGVFRLPGYIKSLQSGKINGKATPKVKELTPCILQIDGDNGMAPLAIQQSGDPLIACARKYGLAAAGLIRIHHFSALWIEIEMLVEAGLCAMAFTSYMPTVAPAGGKKPFYGTNPMAFGWPGKNGSHLVFDQASATKAKGDVMVAAREGHTLEPGVGIDAEGNPSTDPDEVLKGCILPFGGYKGANIALMIELLAGPLIGETTSPETAARDNHDGGPPQGGELILAFDPTKFSQGSDPNNSNDLNDPYKRGEKLFTDLLGMEGTRLPGSRRRENRKKSETVTLPESLHKTILDYAG